MNPLALLPLAGLGLILAGCMPASEHAKEVAAGAAVQDRLTLGTVQRQIRVGMAADEVVATLGAPNMVTTDDRRRESWVYDRIATEQVYSSSAGGATALFIGGSSRAGAAQTSQRTLTVIVKFDEAQRVRDFSYRSSSF